MSFVSSWRTALRIARREARRSTWRSLLVVAMIAIPVLCLTFAAVSYDMFTLTPDETADRTMGTAEARMTWQSHGQIQQIPDGDGFVQPAVVGGPTSIDEQKPGTTDELRAKLPAGSTLLTVANGVAEVRTADGVGRLNAIFVDGSNPMTRGYLTMLEGRAPTAPTEVALSEKAVARLGVTIGGTVRSGDGTHSYTVVGLVEFPSQLEETLLFAPYVGEPPSGVGISQSSWLVHTPGPVTWDQVTQLNGSGISVVSRAVLRDLPPVTPRSSYLQQQLSTRRFQLGTLIAGLALLEIVLLAGPAFAVGARRRQRELALVAANGGTPAHVRRIVLADGVVLGLVGAVVGLAAGIAGAFTARPYIEDLVAHARAGAYRVFPVALVAITALAVVTGLLAALVPAFITARQNVVTSLAGRRGVTRSKKRWLLLGLVMIGIGSAIVLYGTTLFLAEIILAGMVVGELGLVLCTPSLVGLIARIGRILPLAPRVALRDAARNRAAAAPAISAVMAAVAGSVALGLYFEADTAKQQNQSRLQQSMQDGYATIFINDSGQSKSGPTLVRSNPDTLVAAARTVLPVKDTHLVSVASCHDPTNPNSSCDLQLLQNPATVCLYDQVLREQRGELTNEQMRAANADERCHRAGYSPLGMYGSIVVDDGSILADLAGAGADDVAAATAVLRAGGIVMTDGRFVTDGKATFAIVDLSESVAAGKSINSDDVIAKTTRTTLPAYVLTTGNRSAGTVMSPAAAQAAHLRLDRRAILVSTTRMPTAAEEDRFNKAMIDLGAGGYVQRPIVYQRSSMLYVIMGAAALITLGAAGIGTGLAAADGRADLSTLAAVGASPRLRRGLSLSQSAVIAGLGSVLGAGAGLGAAFAVMIALNQQYANIWPGPEPFPLVMPWLSLGAALIVVPALAMLGAGLLTRSRLPIERRI